MKQTAVEFISKGLFDILQEAEDNNIFEVGTQNFKRYIEMFLEQAKEMEKQQQGYSEEEVWTQTMYLRFFLKRKNGCKSEKILQQLYTSNLGNREWTDIPKLNY